MLEAVAAKLNSASVATTGTNLFIGIMPSSPSECLAVYEYAGTQPLEVMQDDDATLERPSIQVIARGDRNDYPTARNLIVAARNELTSVVDETISGVRFLRINQISSINSVGLDDNDRPLFTLSLQAVVER